MNRKGFTLVELIGVVVILGIIIGIAVPSYIAVSNNIRSKNYDQKIDNIKAKALEYARDYNVESITIPVKVLIEEGYLAEENPDNGDNEKITNPLGGYLDCTNIDIVRVDDSYEISISDTKNCNTEGLVNDSNILIKIYEYRDNNLGDSIGTNRNVNWTNSSKVILYADVSRISNVKENVTWSFGTKSISKSGNIATSPTSDTSYANILEVEALVFLNTEYTFSINTEDGLVSQKVLVKIDREKPSANASVSSEWTKENNKDVLISGSDGNGSGVKSYYIGDNDNVSNPEVFNLKYENDSKKDYLSVPLDVGTYYLYAIDNAGNISNSYKFTVSGIDKNGPVCKYPTGNSTWTNQNVVLTYGCNNDLGTGCAENQEQTTTIDFTAKTYPLKYTIKDNLGNETTCERSIDVFVDKTAPKCESSGGSDTWTNGTRTITGTCYDDESGCVGNVNKLYNYEMNSTTESPGVVYDKVGNSTVCPNQTVKIDKTPPTCTPTTSSNGWTNKDVTVYGICSDDMSGCKDNKITGATYTEEGSYWKSPGTIYDNVGNSTICASANVLIDKTPPTISVSFDSTLSNKSKTISVTTSDNLSGVITKQYITANDTIDSFHDFDDSYVTNTNGSGIKIMDRAGNVATYEFYANIDNSSPQKPSWGFLNYLRDCDITRSFTCTDQYQKNDCTLIISNSSYFSCTYAIIAGDSGTCNQELYKNGWSKACSYSESTVPTFYSKEYVNGKLVREGYGIPSTRAYNGSLIYESYAIDKAGNWSGPGYLRIYPG